MKILKLYQKCTGVTKHGEDVSEHFKTKLVCYDKWERGNYRFTVRIP